MKNEKLQLKFKNFLFRFWPVILIVSLWFVFASPYFLKNKVPYPSTYQVNHFHPWSLYQKFWGPVKNGAMPDVVDQIYPWKHFTIDTWKKGEIPFWNPNNFAGNPNLANFQSAVLSPFNLLFFIFSFADAMSMLILLQPLLAGIFMYLFVRSLKLSKTAGFISSIAFMFCGFITVWMVYATLGYAILFLPLALFSIEKYYQTKKRLFLLLLLMSIPLSFFSGHFQISLYFLTVVFAYVLYKFLLSKKIFHTMNILAFIFLGLLVSLLQIIPSIEFYGQAVRSTIFQIGETIPWGYFPTLLAPDFFGNPVTRNDWFGHYAEWNAYIGFLPLLLAIYALLKIKKPQTIFLFIIAIMSVFLSLHTPLITFLANLRIPVVSTSAASRIIVVFSFSFAVLSGFGFDQLIDDIKGKKIRQILFLLLGFLTIFLILWIMIALKLFIAADKINIAKSNLIFPTLLFLASSAMILVMIIRNKIINLISYVLIFIVMFDMLRFTQKWMPFDPKEFVFSNMPVIEAMKENVGYGRVYGNLGAQVNSYYGIPAIEGYDPLYVGRYGEFIRSADSGQFLQPERSVVKLLRNTKYTDKVLDLLGVNIIYHPIADTNQSWAYPVWKDKKRFSLIFQDGTTQLFKNNTAMDRVGLFYKYDVVKDKQEIIKRFYSEDFDFRNTLILEEKPDLSVKVEETKILDGQVKIISYTPDKVTIKVYTPLPALLFLSDNFYPKWEAKVNRVSSKIYRADYSFRAVVVPEGNSIVEFSYKGFF